MPISELTDRTAGRSRETFPAILLLGPTGAGKTPLGELLEARGLAGRPCLHFDFGAELRRLAESHEREGAVLAPADVGFLRLMLDRGALLEDDRLPLAMRILEAFLERRRARPEGWVVLNGLPRHAGQARGIEMLLEIRHVVELVCDPATVVDRIRRDAGGDRTGRADDDPEAVRNRLRTYELRTLPLVDHYAARGAAVHRLRVAAETMPKETYDGLCRSVGAGSR